MGRPRKNPSGAGTQATFKKISALPGFFDVNTQTDPYWDLLLKRFSKIARVYGFSRFESPLLEDARFLKTVYSNSGLGRGALMEFGQDGQALALRPSQLPGILRNFQQQKLFEPGGIFKWHYSGFTARKDLAENASLDYEFGCEILGSFNHLNEAQGIASAWEFFSEEFGHLQT